MWPVESQEWLPFGRILPSPSPWREGAGAVAVTCTQMAPRREARTRLHELPEVYCAGPSFHPALKGHRAREGYARHGEEWLIQGGNEVRAMGLGQLATIS